MNLKIRHKKGTRSNMDGAMIKRPSGRFETTFVTSRGDKYIANNDRHGFVLFYRKCGWTIS